MVVYSNLKLREKDLQPDWCDLFIPKSILAFICNVDGAHHAVSGADATKWQNGETKKEEKKEETDSLISNNNNKRITSDVEKQ